MEGESERGEVKTSVSIELVPVDQPRSSSSSTRNSHGLAVPGFGIDSDVLLYSQMMDVCQGVDLAEPVQVHWTKYHACACVSAIALGVSLLIIGILVLKGYAHLIGIIGPFVLGAYLVASPFGGPSEAPTVLVQYLIRFVLVAASLVFAYLTHIYRNCSASYYKDEAWTAAHGGLMAMSHSAHENVVWTRRNFASLNFMNFVVTVGAIFSVFRHRRSTTIAFDMRIALCLWLHSALGCGQFLIIRACGFFDDAFKAELSASFFTMERVVIALLCVSVTRRLKLFESLLKQPLCAGYSCRLLDGLTLALLLFASPCAWPRDSSWQSALTRIGITCIRFLGSVVARIQAYLVCFAYRRVQQISINEAACLDASSSNTWESSRLQKALQKNMCASVACLILLFLRFLSRVAKDLLVISGAGQTEDGLSFQMMYFFLAALPWQIFIMGTQMCVLTMVRGSASGERSIV